MIHDYLTWFICYRRPLRITKHTGRVACRLSRNVLLERSPARNELSGENQQKYFPATTWSFVFLVLFRVAFSCASSSIDRTSESIPRSCRGTRFTSLVIISVWNYMRCVTFDSFGQICFVACGIIHQCFCRLKLPLPLPLPLPLMSPAGTVVVTSWKEISQL